MINTISLPNIELNIDQLITALQQLDPDVRSRIASQIQADTTITKSVKKRQFGLAKGLIIISPDFDDPIKGFEEYL